MARTTATVSFQAIELRGSLLPSSLLEQVARLQAPLQKEADYGLAKGERLRERIDAAWVRVKEIWQEYKDLRERAAQSVTGLHASMRLLREVLGWPDLQPCSGWQHGDTQFPITHRAFEGAVPLIVRGIAADQLDKGSSQFGQEGRRRSPHSCLQECLNADDNANWGLLLTGDRLRLLHDNPSLVKPAYLAVDLELLVEGELFDEFAVLWLLLHASRFRHPQTGSCVLDAWKEQAQETGERVLGQLRNGVQQALEALGNGLLLHPENEALRNQLASGALSGQELHRQLLRLVYRFLFLFTAEDRDLLFPRTLGQEDPRRRIYREGYSVGRLRELAIRRSASEGPYGDLWQTQKLVFLQLRQSSSPLGLPGLGGLFAEPQCRALEECELANRFLLRAIRAIGWFQAGDTLTRVNYRDLNTEELGSVYEGLLELHPKLERTGGSWQLSYGGGVGSDRKTTGSYYTPDQLVQLLIVSALLPVIADRLAKASTPEEKEKALLAIRVLDPACGSGHFLLAAARRLALELARIRAGDEEPSEELRQECLREVVAHCIYGVDKNPMAVELCKVALWIEAVDPGKPLSFLDAHIQCGDSLVGVFDPKVLKKGIPDEAYKPLTGDDRMVCTSLKRENANFRKAGQKGILQGTLNLQASPAISRGQQRLKEIEAMPETTLAEAAAKQAAYEGWEQDRSTDPETLAADLYTSAFFLSKTQSSRTKVPTTEHLLLVQSGQEIPDELEQAVERAAADFRFFHWHLRFGKVMEGGGFDCVLGNPPFINAIEDADSLLYKGFTRYTYQDLGGTADLGYLFLSQMLRLRSRSGMVGCVQPRAILNAKSAEGLRQKNGSEYHLNMIYSPNKADFFDGASVFICLLVLGEKRECIISTDEKLSSASWKAAEKIPVNWWQAVAGGPLSADVQSESHSCCEQVFTVFDVSASMTTGDAYAIKPFLLDSMHGDGLRLVTTGLIDPSKCMWGEVPCRYLKEDYMYPRIAPWPGIPKALARRLVKSSRPKIIVAGLSKIVECFVDAEGEFVGAVSTYSIFHPEDSIEALNELCAYLLSPDASSRFVSELGGNAMGGGNITMAKSFLQGLPLPNSLA